MNIMTVCTGNICRSVLSWALLRRALAEAGLEHITVTMSGTRAQPWYSVYGVLADIYRDEGLDPDSHQAVRTTAGMVDESDLVLVMEHRHRDELLELVPGAGEKIVLLKEYAGLDGDPEITDPLGHPDEEYYRCLELIREAVDGAIKQLSPPA